MRTGKMCANGLFKFAKMTLNCKIMFSNYKDKARLFFSFLGGNEIQIVRADGAVKNKSCLLASTGAQHTDAYIRTRWMHCWQQAFRRASHAFTDGTDGLICDVSHRSGFVVFKHRECVWFYEIWITQININTKYTVLRKIPFQSLFNLMNIAKLNIYWSVLFSSKCSLVSALYLLKCHLCVV